MQSKLLSDSRGGHQITVHFVFHKRIEKTSFMKGTNLSQTGRDIHFL